MIRRLYCNVRESLRNAMLRQRLSNFTPTLICSNCTGGFIYHWLGLEFRSPFINLSMTNEDFVTALEDFDKFISTPLIEDMVTPCDCPYGIGYGGTRVCFVHYKTWKEAIEKWEARKRRIDMDNMAIMLCDIRPDDGHGSQRRLIERFEKLPFKHKIVFSDHEYPEFPSVVYLPRWKRNVDGIYRSINSITGRRPIDDFDFVGYINSIKP